MIYTNVVKIQNTFYVQFFFSHVNFLYEITFTSVVDSGMPQMDIWRMRNVCRKPTSKNTHSD